MAFFSSSKEEIKRVEKNLERSFFTVKKDIGDVKNQVSHSLIDVRNNLSLVSQWLAYFNEKIQSQDEQIAELGRHVASQDIKGEIRKYVDEYYSLEPLLARINQVESRLNEIRGMSSLSSDSPGIQSQLKFMQQKLATLEQRKLNMREKIIKKISRNSGEYIKGVMLSYIRKYEKISAIRLKEMVVEEQGLCSKSSFYRMLEELENDDDVGTIKTNKEKHYFFKLAKKI